VAAVIFSPDGGTRRRSRQETGPRTNRGTGLRTALVLGAGGVLGAAWMTGALASLADRLPCAAADIDLIVGTSAGSVFAAALRCHAELAEMVAWQRGQATGILGESAALAAHDGPLPPLPHLRVGSVPLACAGLLRPLQVPPWVAASGWLPHGRGQHAALRSLIDALDQRHYPRGRSDKIPPTWADGRTWISAVDYDSGQRVLFGAGGAPPAALADAVVASCSIPGWYTPARIGGRRYVDGGVRSATSLGALRGTDVQDIYVLAPMASTEPDHPFQPHLRLERRFRQVQTSILLRQARALSAQGKRVTVLTPGPADLAAMGMNLMDPRRREAVLEVSFLTCAESLASLGRGRPLAA
jgi:NTE family protein